VSASDAETLAAPAKLNLFLELLAVRPDGYHELESDLVALDRADLLTVRVVRSGPSERPGPPATLGVEGPAASPDVPRDAANLAVRGALLVRELASGSDRGPAGAPRLAIRLEKRVPSQSGLGGASADAVAAALGAARALGIAPDDPALAERIRALGADCAFFLDARATGLARCTGLGERVEPLAGRVPFVFLVLVPAERAPTAAVYRAARVPPAGARRPAPDPGVWTAGTGPAALDRARAGLFNRLEEAALRAVPALVPWRRLLDEAGGEHLRLSGSGSAFFGLFADEAGASAALDELRVLVERRGLALRDAFLARARGAGAGAWESK